MSKYYYNGVLLPELPQDVLAEYPYAFIGFIKSSGKYQILASTQQMYVTSSGIKRQNNNNEPFLYCSEGDETWTTGASGNYGWTIDSDRHLIWSNHNIPNDSATSTNIYLYGSEPTMKPLKGWILTENSSLFSSSDNSFELGTEILCKKTTKLIGARVFVTDKQSTNNISVKLWDSNGTKIAETSTLKCYSGKWFNLIFSNPIEIIEGNSYTISANFVSYYHVQPLSLEFSDIASFVQSRYTQTLGSYPSTVFNQKLYGLVDILYETEEVIEDDSKYKYLIRSNNTLYTISDNLLTALSITELTSDVFQTHGFNELPEWAVVSTLTNPEILYWQGDEEAELPTITATMTSTPFPQTLVSPNYDMSDTTILGIECAYVTASSDVVFAISVDDGVTWYMWTGEEWGTLTDTKTGMTAETINAITTEQWAGLMTTGQFKVRMTLFDENSSFTSFVMDYIN